ncbi:MAG: hypothetical protein NXI24_05790 [bacterium]|nr:hypothetical protein [bacterium]
MQDKLYTMNAAKRIALAAGLLVCMAVFAPACEPGGETRVARWPLSVFPGAEKKKALATLSQGERVELIAPGEVFSQIRMAGGQEGFVESKHLFVSAAVLTGADSRLYRRPSASSGEAASGKYLLPGAVFFIKQSEKNEEGDWLSVEGGRKGNFFRGWLKADASYSEDVDDVLDGLKLAEAIRKSDVDVLDELADRSGAIGAAAAAALVDIEGLDEEDLEGDLEGDSGDESEADGGESDEDSSDDASTSNESQTKPAQESGNENNSGDKPAPPTPPAGDVSMPGPGPGANSAAAPSQPPPPPSSL